jgi:hypothetical protein
MKKVVLSGAALLTAFVLPGCPVYPEERGCFSHADCPSGYACHAAGYCVLVDGHAGSGSVAQCDEPKDCRVNETCGRDGRCHVGDCTFQSIGCVSGFECRAVDRVWSCTPSGGTGGTSGAGGSSGYGGDAAVDGSQPDANAGGTAGAAPDGAVPDGGGGDATSDSASDAPSDSASDSASDSSSDARSDAAASDAARDSASDAPRG